MKTKQFKFLGFIFTPLRNFTQSEKRQGLKLPFYSIGISNYDKSVLRTQINRKWNLKKFYDIAERKNMVADIYLINDEALVIPMDNELFAYGKEEAQKFSQPAKS